MGIGTGSDVAMSAEGCVFGLLRQEYAAPYCVFDVGANRGDFVDEMLRHIPNKDVSIHCFEPNGESFKLLTTRLTGVEATLNHFGLGTTKTDTMLYYNEPGSALASLTKRNLDHLGIAFDRQETVFIDTLDNYCLEHAIERIHLLKLDIEGHELDALAGAAGMFAKDAIDIVQFEFGGTNIDTKTFFRDFWYFFSNNNMKILRITPTAYLFPIKSYREMDEQFRTTNFIAIKNRHTETRGHNAG